MSAPAPATGTATTSGTGTGTATTSGTGTGTAISHIVISLPSFLIISLLLLLLHSFLLFGYLRLYSLPDTNPFLSRLSSPSTKSPPFLHLSPSLPFAENFFFSPSLTLNPPSPNSSLHITLTTVKSRVSKLSNNILFSLLDSDESSSSSSSQEEFSFATAGIHLLYLFSLLLNAQSAALLAFALCYATAFGVVFNCVASNVLSRPMLGVAGSLWCGARLGVRRLVGFLFFKWGVRDVIVQFLYIFLSGDVEDPNKLFKLFVKMKVMPFSLTVLEWNEDGEMFGFLVVWGVLDFVVSMILVFVPWIHVVDDVERTGKEVVREGVFLVSLVSTQFAWMKCVEVVLSGRLGWWFFSAFCGRRFAMWVQAVFEVYFMVVGLVLYLEARRKEFELGGRRFGREELERCVDRL